MTLGGRLGTGLAALVAVTVLGACGDDGGGPSSSLAVEGGERGQAMYFDPADPTIEAGSYEVTFDNVGAVHHELAFLDAGGRPLAGRSIAGRTKVTFEVEFEPGTYRMVCREPGHEAAGMVGTLTAS